MIILPEDKAIISLLSAEDAQQVLLALFSSDDDMPFLSPIANMAFTTVKTKSDRISERKSRAGKIGGAPQNNQNAKKQAEQAADAKTSFRTDTVSDTVTNTETNGGYPPTPRKQSKPPAPPKIKFADFVSMTNDEYSSLVAKVGNDGALRCIEILDNYKGANGKKYTSDYRAILNWVVQRYEDELVRGRKEPCGSNAASTPADVMAQLYAQAKAEEAGA